ncbi:MAG: hypothetical protein WC882_00975 [Candidatus Gracilibacteria bacterium]
MPIQMMDSKGGYAISSFDYADSLWPRLLSFAFPFLIVCLVIAFILLILYLMKNPLSSGGLFRNFSSNLKAFYLYAVAFVGIVVLLINGVTLLRTVLQTQVFGMEYEYMNSYECYNKWDPVTSTTVVLSEEELAQCLDRAADQAKLDFSAQTKRSYAEGLAGLILGFLIWLPHFVWARKLK